MDAMSPLDAMFLYAEDGITHMHIGSCAIFAGPCPSIGEMTDLIESKLPRLIRYRQKVKSVPGGLSHPVWVDDPHFNIGYHVRHSALPPPGDERDLENLMGRLMSQELDRYRPLWEAWMIEGLPDGRWALISKVHHCMVDGISGTDLMAVLLDADRAAITAPPEPWRPAPEPSGLEMTVDAVRRFALRPVHQVLGWGARPPSVRRSLQQAGQVVAGLGAFTRLLASSPRRPLSLAGTIGPHRRWAAARCRLDEVKAIKRALGGSVNDVVLAAITGAFHALLIDRGERVDEDVVLRSLVPVSVRRPGDHSASNQVSLMIAELPVGVADPVSRYRTITKQMAALKSSHEIEAGEAVAETAAFVPPVLVALAVRATMRALRRVPQPAINTVTTNVPGPQFPLYALGREMLEYLPFVPLTEGMRIGVAIMSYNGHVTFGITGDYDTAPDVHAMATHVESEMHRLFERVEQRTVSLAGRRRG